MKTRPYKHMNLKSISVVLLLAASAVQAEDNALSQRFGLVHAEPEFLTELGSGWSRHDFTWAGIERERGVFDYGEWPRRLDGFLERGVTLLPILDYAPAWNPEVAPADEETLDLWARYVERTVAKFRGKLQYWQVWNEPNLSGFWKPKPSPRDYAELLRRSYLAAKKADPTVQIVGVNTSDIDLEFTEQVFRYGGLEYCDVLAFQPYRIAPEVGHFEDMKALRDLIARYGEPRPIWFTEVGWGSQHFPFRDANDLLAERPSRRHAAFLVRYMVLIQAAGVDKVFWFSQTAGGAGLEDGPRGKKRLSFYAYQYLIKTLDGYTRVRELTPSGANGIHAFLFDFPDKAVVVSWSVNGPQPPPRCLLAPGEVCDMFGKYMGRQVPHLTSEPIYATYTHASPSARAATNPVNLNAALRASAPRLWLAPGQQQDVEFICQTEEFAQRKYVLNIEAYKGLRVNRGSWRGVLSEGVRFGVAARGNCRPHRGFVTIGDGTGGKFEWKIEVNVVPPPLWKYQGETTGPLTPTLVRRPDGTTSILVAAFDSPELLCLSAQGKKRWSYVAESPINSSVAVGDLTGDGDPEIIAAAPGRQSIFALSADGVLLWRTKLPGDPLHTHPTQETGKPEDLIENPQWRWTYPALSDLEGDGRVEIVYADNRGFLSILAPDGTLQTYQRVSDRRCDQPVCVADISGDAAKEIVVGDEAGAVRCASHEGKLIWKAELGAAVKMAPKICALNAAATPSIFVGTQGEELWRISNTGEPLWSVEVGGTMDLGTGVAFADLDRYGTMEVIISTRNHELLALDATGRILWRVETGAQLRSEPVIGDVDGDGVDEILIGSADHLLYCVGPRGDVRWTINVGNRLDASPLLADLNDDGVLDLVLPVRGGTVCAWSAGQG
ncbi:MAG: PQQ-binding-like beta-propeller repeat protein [Candidatus Hydrogenedentes bacterium]|nr:PQQ-binding-like beta-propeller repeat protein [Candidatus Hydrogenedentota bacterium]